MPGYLLDTMVVSETTKRTPSSNVMAWLRDRAIGEQYVSALTFAEIHAGIAAVHPKDTFRRRHLVEWVQRLEARWRDATLPVDLPVARLAGRYFRDLPDDPIDALIAATATINGLTVATRNVRHFRLFGVPVVDPYI